MNATVVKFSAAAILTLALAAEASSAFGQAGGDDLKPFQAEMKEECNGLSCSLLSAPVAANRRLQIEEVSCNVSANSTIAQFINTAKIVNGGGGIVRQVGVLTGNRFSFLQTAVFHSRQPTLIFVNEGQRFKIDFNAFGGGSSMSAFCTIAGFLAGESN